MDTALPAPLRMVGAEGSPYSRKLRAVLRYRRIPHAWIVRGSAESRGLPEPRAALLPQLLLPGADGALAAETDSTPLLRRRANADALARGAERVECTIDGRPWVQAPFPYQGKCLRWLREGYGALAGADRSAVDAALRGTGCEVLFAG